MPMIAVWRIVCTVLGVLVEALAVILIFPVSAKQVRSGGGGRVLAAAWVVVLVRLRLNMASLSE